MSLIFSRFLGRKVLNTVFNVILMFDYHNVMKMSIFHIYHRAFDYLNKLFYSLTCRLMS